MANKLVTFSLNQHDRDGYIYDECILLHLREGNVIIRMSDLDELKKFIEELNNCADEIIATMEGLDVGL